MKFGWMIGIIILVLVVGGGAFYISQNHSTTPTTASANTPIIGRSSDITPNPSPPAQTANTYTMDIKDFAFADPMLEIKTGESVVWTNQDSMPHTITSISGSELSSPLLSKGLSYTHTFIKVGTYDYYCTIHPSMKGTVIVS